LENTENLKPLHLIHTGFQPGDESSLFFGKPFQRFAFDDRFRNRWNGSKDWKTTCVTGL